MRLAWLSGAAAMGLLLVACGEEQPLVPCTTDDDCTLPDLCGEEGLCVTPEPGPADAPCLHDDHCASGSCRDTGDGELVCVVPCDTPSECEADRICAPVVTVGPPPEDAGKPARALELLCRPPGGGDRFFGEVCGADETCRTGLCHDERCTHPCGSCPAEVASCDEEATLTREALSLSHGICRWEPSLVVEELGSLATPAGAVAELSFELAGGIDSFILFGLDEEDLGVSIHGLTGPDGTQLIAMDDPTTSMMRSHLYVGTGTALVPGTDNPAGAVKAGSYRVQLKTYEDHLNKVETDGEVERVAVVRRRRPGQGGLIDLYIHLAPATGLVAATAKDDPYLVASLARLDTLYRGLIGVAIGEVEFGDLPASENVIATGDQARALCRTHSKPGAHGQSINLFVVQTIEFDATHGFAGGMPGVPGLVGHPGSGIIQQKEGSPQVMGAALAHEIGHYLGLMHTTERGAALADTIGDTPVCPPGTQIADCPDQRNLMFPIYPTSDPMQLSPGQIKVARGSPWQYQVAYPDLCGDGIYGADLSAHLFASGSTSGPSRFQGSCGGDAHGEQVHLFRLTEAVQTLSFTAHGTGFDPVVHVRRGTCTDAAAELGCEAAEPDQGATVTLDQPQPGAYFVFVDGKDGGGIYRLSVQVTK